MMNIFNVCGSYWVLVMVMQVSLTQARIDMTELDEDSDFSSASCMNSYWCWAFNCFTLKISPLSHLFIFISVYTYIHTYSVIGNSHFDSILYAHFSSNSSFSLVNHILGVVSHDSSLLWSYKLNFTGMHMVLMFWP